MAAVRKGRVIGTDIFGVNFSGSYDVDASESTGWYRVRLKVTLPANTPVIQSGATSGPHGDVFEIDFRLPPDFLTRDFIRLETKYGPLNARFVRLGDIDD